MNILTGVSSLHKWIDSLSQHLMACAIHKNQPFWAKVNRLETFVIWHIICYLVSLGPEGNLIQWCTGQVEWLPVIHSHVSEDRTPVCVVVLNVSLWLTSHENRTQSNRKDSNQCFRPEIHDELFLAGLVCWKEVLSSGCYKCPLTMTAPRSWPDLSAWPWALR